MQENISIIIKYILFDNKRKRIYNHNEHGPVAQLGERSVRIRKVMGSNPTGSTKEQGSCLQAWTLFVFVGFEGRAVQSNSPIGKNSLYHPVFQPYSVEFFEERFAENEHHKCRADTLTDIHGKARSNGGAKCIKTELGHHNEYM